MRYNVRTPFNDDILVMQPEILALLNFIHFLRISLRMIVIYFVCSQN